METEAPAVIETERPNSSWPSQVPPFRPRPHTLHHTLETAHPDSQTLHPEPEILDLILKP